MRRTVRLPPPAPAAPAVAAPEPEVEPEVAVSAVEVRLRRAAPWRRGLSWAVDGAVLGCFGAAVLAVGALATGLGRVRGSSGGVAGLASAAAGNHLLLGSTLVFLAATYLVYATLAHALMGATAGKRVAGLHLVGRDGRRPSLGRSAARSVLAVLSFLLLGLGCLLALFTRTGRALHDFLAGTYVVEIPER